MDSTGVRQDGSTIVVPERSGKATRPSVVPGSAVQATRVGWWVSGGLLAVSLVDLVALWWPLGLGSLNWEFATIGGTADALPLPTLTLFAMLAMAAMMGRRRRGLVLAVVMGGGVALCLLLLVVHTLNLPLISAAIEEGPSRAVVYEAAWKAMVTLAIYIVLFSVGTRLSWRLFRSSNPNPE